MNFLAVNIFDIVFDFKNGLQNLYVVLESFLFTKVYILLVGNVSVWQLLLGLGLPLFLVWGLLK